MKNHAAFVTMALTILCLLALLEFTPQGLASKDKRLPERARANRDSRLDKASKRKRGTLRASVSGQNVPINEQNEEEEESDPDLPARLKNLHIDKERYLQMRDEYIARLRGIEPGRPFDPSARGRAIEQMNKQIAERDELVRKSSSSKSPLRPSATEIWLSLGPRPVPNGSAQGGANIAVTGRVTAIAPDPTSASIVYLGTAQGGVWRTTDGGTTWTAIFDNAQSLAIGALAVAPSNHDILYIGTGEANRSADSFAGVGLYRIDNASTTTGALADLQGPINPAFSYTSSSTGLTVNTTAFGGRAISRIAVHPSDPATIFVGTYTGVAGANGSSPITNGSLVGVYRSTNATAAPASVTFAKLPVITLASASNDVPATGNRRITDLILEPGNPDNLLVGTFGANAVGDGGIFRSTNALASPASSVVFTNTLTVGAVRIQFGINKTGAVITVMAAIDEPAAAPCPASQAGRLHRSVDGGATWPATLNPASGAGGILTAADGFCGGQCFYNIDVEIDPNDVNNVYLAGNARGTCSDSVKKSGDGGQTWTRDDNAVHADTHVFAFDTVSSPSVVYTGDDGGVWKRVANAAAGTAWTSLNNSPLDTIQFESVAVHPTDRNFTIGGTQDNGTEAQDTPPAGPSVSGIWINAEGGDGGYALIDQSSDATNITMYHTFFNQAGSQIGFDRANVRSCLAFKNGWEFRGIYAGQGAGDPSPSCDGTAFDMPNGIDLNDAVLFYAPMALGPNAGTNNILSGTNTVYFGTDRLYRSIDKGDTMSVVSQAPIVSSQPISTIGISPQDDTYRIVGLQNGQVWGTSTGSSTLVNITSGSFPAPLAGASRFTGRVFFDPLNKDTAYVTFSYYTPAGQGVWKITNFGAATNAAPVAPVWSAAGTGIPSIPINAFVIAPQNSNLLFAGTDIGVYVSVDSGATWNPYGTGLPRVAVFDMAIQRSTGTLRVATHGRGMWEIPVLFPTAASAMVSGSVQTPDGSPLAGVTMRLTGASTATTITDSGGNYRFDNVNTNNFYTVTPALANYHFTPVDRSFSLLANMTDAVFTATAEAIVTTNAIESAEYFVRQQYLDFLGREPEQGGFDYWTERINECGGDADCIRARRIDVSAAFFVEPEFQETGSFIYRLYRGALGRQLSYAEFSTDRQQVIGGPNLDSSKAAFADAFVARAEFIQKYQANTSAESFVDALLQTISGTGGGDLSSERSNLIAVYNSGANLNASRSLVVRTLAENAAFSQSVYNEAFVLMEYFGYLRRGPDQEGYDFWLNVLNNREPGNYRGMVCSFITSIEYQKRFSPVITRSNAECGR